MRSEALDRLEQELGVLVRRVRRMHSERPAHVVLSLICEHGPVRAAEVSQMIGADKAAVSRHVQHLVEVGHVDAAPDPEDGRAYLLTGTDAGRAHLADVHRERRRLLEGRLAEWHDDDLSDFVGKLSRYNASVG